MAVSPDWTLRFLVFKNMPVLSHMAVKIFECLEILHSFRIFLSLQPTSLPHIKNDSQVNFGRLWFSHGF